MNIITIEEQTFKQVCGRFSGFASQVERICKENTRQPDEWLSGREVCALLGGKSSVRCPLKPKRFYPLKIFNNAPSKSLDRWGYYYFSLFPSVCRHLPDTFSV